MAFSIIFLERKDPTVTLAWLVILLFLPVVGFILYLFFGQNLHKIKMFQMKKSRDELLKGILIQQEEQLDSNIIHFYDPILSNYNHIIKMFIRSDETLFTQNNTVSIFTDGQEKFSSLLKDIENAEHHIHILYYIFNSDIIGNEIMNALIRKAQQGVEVKILYDGYGSKGTDEVFFRKIEAAGGEISCFFPLRLPKFHFRLNFRNHRKIIVIDGKIGYVGGFNIGDDYLGNNHRYGDWRDTHLRITGDAVYSLQIRWILDWEYSVKNGRTKRLEKLNHQATVDRYPSVYFPEIPFQGNTAMQIVSSGPDSDFEQIKYGYIKLINLAKKTIFIQTPYFIPDISIIEALKIAVLSGVDVRIMIPSKPDHPFVYWATLNHAASLLKFGVKLFRYNKGFLHSKTIVVDGLLSSIGTANWDVRSFKLNFEVNAFIYDRKVSQNLHDIFLKDQEKSLELTVKDYERRSKSIIIKESISRLLSSIL